MRVNLTKLLDTYRVVFLNDEINGTARVYFDRNGGTSPYSPYSFELEDEKAQI